MAIGAHGSMFREKRLTPNLDDAQLSDLGKVGDVTVTKDETMSWKGKDNRLKLKNLCRKSLSSGIS